MPKCRPGINSTQLKCLKEIVGEVGQRGPFTAAAVLFSTLQTGITNQPQEIEALLEDLVDVGELWTLGGNPQRWELAGRDV